MIGIGITTFNRPKVFQETLEKHLKYLPDGAKLVVVEDAHTKCQPYVDSPDHRFSQRAGIPKSKNKCLELLDGCDDVFLFDDDTFPTADGWHLPYVNGEYKHMCYTFAYPTNYSVGMYNYHHLANGCMMYIHRSVITRIGGFDENFGIGKYEHVQYSNRAHACGLIPHPFISPRTEKKIHCLDENKTHERTLEGTEINSLLSENREHFYKTKMSTDFIAYK